MNNKKVQKLNRAAVAAVLAASGAAVTMPYSVVKADSPFSDVTTTNSHYDSIMKLYNRGIISGFEDKTFRPSKEVTRGQAAKMLALTLGLDIYNVKNPKFKDVPTTSAYYPYIAALVEQGVISGYVDNTFRPGEVITRNQMAKIIVKGFQFGETINLTHKFEDVSNKNANRFYIQTLVNLGITTGTSAITFSPNKAVTRAQLSSFLIRAEEANVYGAKVKEITKIEQISGVTYIYLNGVKHTVNASLRDILNVKNTETLKGAHIEGTIVGSEIRTLNKITFNAVGAQNNVLTFDGNGSTYRGAVEITGNHLRFANWTVTGEVKIAPIQTQAFSNLYKPLTVKTIASLKVASDLIDWGSQTPPSQLEPGENDGGLIEIPPDNKPVLPKMKTVEHDIQFVNVKMRALAITANRTKVRSNLDLAHVTVGGYVREFELHTDVKELYIESDDNVTFYGVADIEKLYKNSYKSLNLYADSVTQLIAVDNASGWIDLGDYYYVDKFIIPPNKLPHDIFNDFINDSDKIGNITDPGGTEVDRDPIENGIVPDWEPPVLTIKNAQTNLATVNVTVNSNEDGIVHYLVKREKDGEPSIREIMQYTGPMGGTKAVSEGQDSIITITDLEDQEKYIIYAVAVDEAGNVSKKVSEAFEITDATPPNIEPAEAIGLPGGKRIEVSMKPNETGTYYYYYEPYLLGVEEYTAAEVKEMGNTNNRNRGGKGKVDQAGEMKFRITDLDPLTDYVVYVVMEDEYGNLMTEAKVMQATTTELDETPPRVDGTELVRVRDTYEFYFNVTEALDPETATNPDNYELFGTAILNIEGQPTTIKPESVQYDERLKRVTIRIPSATALVNGDTIQIKVLPGVTDLAENAFSNLDNEISVENVRNTATYNHMDMLQPVISDPSLLISPDKTNGYLEFTSNKAGTYYYMIIDDEFDWTGIDKEDFYDDFAKQPNPPGLFPASSVLSKYGTQGNNAVVVGKQPQITVPIPPALNPFKSYSLHLIVRDRSGNLSNMIQMPIINDKRAPFISQFTVVPLETTNTGVVMTVGSSEPGQMYIRAVKKDDLTEVARIEAILNALNGASDETKGNLRSNASPAAREAVTEIEKWDKTALNKDSTEYVFRDLDPHEEYIYYIAVEDMVGNLTVFPQGPSANTYDNAYLKAEVYTDGINPFFTGLDKEKNKNVLKLVTQGEFNRIPMLVSSGSGSGNTPGDGYIEHKSQQTFVLTFSEAIKYGTTEDSTAILQQLKTVIQPQLGGLVIEDIEWQDLDGIETWDERKVIFTTNAAPSTAITIDASILTDFTDLGPSTITTIPARPFVPTESMVQYRPPLAGQLNALVGARLSGTPSQVNAQNVYSSETAIFTIQINADLTAMQEYYYVVQNLGSTLSYTPEQIVSYVKSNGTLQGMGGVYSYGWGPVNIADGQTTGSSFETEIFASNANKFTSGQRLQLVTLDQYGNIVGSVSNANPNEAFRAIEYLGPVNPPTNP